MSLEQTIHTRWAADAALSTLVPVARVFTGLAAGNPALPYVVLAGRKSQPEVRTSGSGAVDRVEITFEVFVDDLDDGKVIAAAIAVEFDRTSFALAAGNVLAMQLLSATEQMHDDGVWQATCVYSALVETE